MSLTSGHKVQDQFDIFNRHGVHVGKMDTPEILVTLDTLDTLDTFITLERQDTFYTLGIPDTLDILDIPETYLIH